MQKEKKASAFLSNFEHLLSGGIAGALSRTFTSPIDRIIILRQTQNPKYVDTSLVNILIKMYKTEGILSYFKGNGVNCLRISPFQAIEFYSYDKYKTFFDYFFENKIEQKKKFFLCGIMAGMTASSCVYPLDLMRTVFSFQTDKAEYKGVMRSIYKIYCEKGFFGLYKGWSITMMGIGPYSGVKLSVYNLLHNRFSDKKYLGQFTSLALGSLSGCIAVTVTYPTDLIRKQIHIQVLNNEKLSVIQVIKKMYSTKGIQGFYLGLGITYLKVIPSTGLAFAINEKFLKLFRIKEHQQ